MVLTLVARLAGRLWVVAAALLAVGWPWSEAAGRNTAPDRPWPHQWPVDAPVSDGFRPPASPWGAGNRGLEFATVWGEPVRSAGSGRVVFAGRIGERWFVTVAHPDRLRISYSHLERVRVVAGDVIEAGTVIATAGSRLHVGARAGEAYLDPAVVFGGRRQVRLVPTRTGL